MMTIKGGYKVGKQLKSWKDGLAQTITFVMTEDCNLRCKYCYITGKAAGKRMSLDVAKKFIDYIFTDEFVRSEAVIVEFIGGEPFLEVEMIDQITDYFKQAAFLNGSDWAWNYRISICTNGVNYANPEVQNYIEKNKGKLSLTITLDGVKAKHDLNRVFPDGTGSFDTIIKNIPMWVNQFGGATKVTFASADLKYLKDSIVELWSRGIVQVASNVVFENAWKEGDDVIYEQQLKDLADYVLDNKLYDQYYCTFFDESLGGYYDEEDLDRTSCGAGKMIAIGPNGNLYPCIRYKDYSLNHKKEWTIGNVEQGIDMDKVRPFMTASTRLQSDDECLNCEIASGCNFCQGFNYDDAETPTNFHRAKYICKMHKARVRANNYYFNKLYNRFGIERDRVEKRVKKMYILLADDYVTYCEHRNGSVCESRMSEEALMQGLQYAHQNFFEPVLIHSKSEYTFENKKEYEQYRIQHIVPVKFYEESRQLKDVIYVFEKEDLDAKVSGLDACMFNLDAKDLNQLAESILKLFEKTKNVELHITNLDKTFDEKLYEEQLLIIEEHLSGLLKDGKEISRLNVMTDILEREVHDGCMAGNRSIAYAPDEKLYVCGAYYEKEEEHSIGNLSEGTVGLKSRHLYTEKYQPLCNNCDAYQCNNCVHLNKSTTQEVNVAPAYKCRKSYIERKVSRQLQQDGQIGRRITSTKYEDPISKLLDKPELFRGYYKYE